MRDISDMISKSWVSSKEIDRLYGVVVQYNPTLESFRVLDRFQDSIYESCYSEWIRNGDV
jgi:hypothetical protein